MLLNRNIPRDHVHAIGPELCDCLCHLVTMSLELPLRRLAWILILDSDSDSAMEAELSQLAVAHRPRDPYFGKGYNTNTAK
jgi:hypothetical protein